MSWHEAGSAWTRAANNRVRLFSGLVVLQVVVVGVLGSILVWVMSDMPSSRFFNKWWLITPIVVMPLAILGPVVQWRRQRRVRRLVPETDGMLCPKCILPLSGAERACDRCLRQFEASAVQMYWTEFFLSAKSAIMTRSELLRRKPKASKSRWSGWPTTAMWYVRKHPPALVAYVFAMWFVGVFTLALLMSRSVIGTALEYASFLFMFLGVGFLGLARSRDDDTLHCSECDYQRTPDNPPSERCPECGARWALGGGVIRGRKRFRPGFLFAGLVGIAAALGLMYSDLSGRFVATATPTSALIKDVTSWGGNSSSWDALKDRQLTAVQVGELVERLMARRDKSGRLHSRARTWITNQMITGAPNEAMKARVFEGLVDVDLEVPERGKVRVPLKATLAVDHRSTLDDIALGCRVVFGGFRTGDGLAAERRSESYEYPLLLMSSPEYEVATTIMPGEPGPVRIRCSLWIIVAPGFNNVVMWQDDGTPVIPPGTVWSKRIDLERTVEVE